MVQLSDSRLIFFYQLWLNTKHYDHISISTPSNSVVLFCFKQLAVTKEAPHHLALYPGYYGCRPSAPSLSYTLFLPSVIYHRNNMSNETQYYPLENVTCILTFGCSDLHSTALVADASYYLCISYIHLERGSLIIPIALCPGGGSSCYLELTCTSNDATEVGHYSSSSLPASIPALQGARYPIYS